MMHTLWQCVIRCLVSERDGKRVEERERLMIQRENWTEKD